jgi:5,10-methylenetetrahydrofolate reductase
VTRDDIVKAPVYFELKVPKWYVDFFNTVDESIKGVEDDDKKFPIIHQIMNLSSFLEIDILTNMCGAKIASFMRGRTTEENRKLFGLSEDWKPKD